MFERSMETRPDPIISRAAAERGSPTVLQVLPALETSGVERGTVDVAKALVAAGWRALVASSGGPLERELERAGGEHVTLPLASKNPLVIRANVGRLADLIEARGVDLVHARSRAPAWSALGAARRSGRPLVTTVHALYHHRTGLKRRYNSVMARGDRVIAISQFIAEYVRQNYHVGEARLRVVPRGIDLGRFDPKRVSAERMIHLARKWRLTDGMPVVMLPGRLSRYKGQAVLLEALSLLGRSDIRCLLVGPPQGRGGYRRKLERLVVARGLESVVQLTDHCSDMPAAYMLADVVVSASIVPEGFGRVIVEAQAMGRPTIATGHGAARETLLPGETGWLTPPDDAQALAAALDWALALDAPAREALAARAMPRVRASFSTETMCARTLAVYRELLDGERGAPGPSQAPAPGGPVP
jgi:glycosyltransferase involved in cell wall biosynthesis